MKLTRKPASKSIQALIVEPLEARIAPATISIGLKSDGRNTEYNEGGGPRPVGYNLLNFTDTSNSSDPISLSVDNAPVGAPNHGLTDPLFDNTYFLQLSAGDIVERFGTTNGYKPFITITTGHVVAYFTDHNNDNEFDEGELTGLSLSSGAVVAVNGTVHGDIATNLNDHKTKSLTDDTVDTKRLVSAKQGIKSLTIGDVTGSIFSASDISKISIEEGVANIYAGSAANGKGFDFFGGSLGGKGTFAFPLAAGQKGASILNITVGSVGGVIQAGDGGAGAKGGSLTGIKINQDTDGFALFAGKGGDGDSATKKQSGGAGGSVTGVYIFGEDDGTANSTNGTVIRAGNGGAGLTTTQGGAGGKVSKVYLGYELTPTGRVESANLSSDAVFIAGGAGGTGKIGGAGGSVTDSKVRTRTPEVNGVEISIYAGDGGTSLSPTGRAGAGGSLTTLDLRNQSLGSGTDILVQAGRGGSTTGNGIGAVGGSITDLQLLSFDEQVIAGNGSDGKKGGAGGSIARISFNNDSSVLPNNLLIDAGRGGSGTGGAGGNAGNISSINIPATDLDTFLINSGTKGNGGDSTSNGITLGAKGGRGSSLANINITDDDSDAQLEAVASVRAGLGGSGSKGGGAGGVISSFNFSATDVTFAVGAGAGGDALDKGKGGTGGTIVNSLFVSTGVVASLPVSGVVQSGNGGAGRGTKGAGGAGGLMKAIQLSLPGNATVQAGNGGSGETTLGFIVGGAAGSGGSITAVGILSNASGVLRAGDAGLGGLKAGNGGSIKGETSLLNGVPLTINGVHADIGISIIAGKGSHGGYGGDIAGISYSSTQEDLTPSPSGRILVQAGDGSSEGKVGGKGGSILHMDSGSVSSGAFQTTSFIAGNGGGGVEVVRAGAGGSITGVTIARGGALGGEFTIKAGDAGDSIKGTKGAAGGSIKTFEVTDIDPATILRSIASGDGGDAIKKGGLGGSVTAVHVQEHDIGVRTGQVFGFSTMGGIFTGIGGKATDLLKGKNGLNGSVIDIGADAISSIVAGRVGAPALAEKVAQINLNKDFTSLLYNLNGVFPSNGAFKLAFNGEEHLFPAGATAKEVQNALNLFNGISNLGGVTVTSTRFGGYEIKFNQPGDRSAFGGIEQIPVKVSESIPGSIKPFTITEIKPGIVNLPIIETRSGQGSFVTLEATPGERFLVTSEQTAGDPDNKVREVQLLDISYLSTHPTGVFTLAFEGETTGQLLPTATAADIQAALNALTSIASQNNGVVVTTSNSGAGRFLITFTNNASQNPITGSFLVSEVQHLDLASLVAIQGSTFSLTYEGESIAQIPTTSTKTQIESALNLLNTIITDGKVVVTDTAPGEFDINFIVNGDRNAILVTDQVREVQTLALGSFSNETSGDLYLYFGTQVTPALSPISTAAQIDAALEALPAIGVGGVVVTEDSLHTFSVTFQTNGQQQELVAQGKLFEKQLLDLTAYSASSTSEFTLKTSSYANVVEQVIGSSLSLPQATTRQGAIHDILAITTRAGVNPNLPTSLGSAESQYLELGSLYTDPFAEFYLDYQGTRTTFLKASASATQVQDALNKLGADVSVASNAPGTYDVTFKQNQNQQQIIGKVGIREIQTLSTNPLTGVSGAEFSLQAGVNTTNPIPNTAASNRVQEALNSLVSLAPFGGVTVTSTGVNAYTFTAKDFGDMPNIVGKGSGTAGHESQVLQLTSFAAIPNTYFEVTFNGATSGPLPTSASAAQIQAALNGLSSVAGLRPDNNGAVVATVPDVAKPNDFRLDFNVFDNQPAISVRLYTDDIAGPNIIVETTPGKQVSLTTTVAQQGSVQNITATTPTAGTAGIAEIQHITLGALAGNAQAEFYLTPDGVAKTAFLPSNASATDIQTALAAIGVNATVTQAGAGSFDITYTANGDATQLTGKIGFRESVNLDTTALSAFIGAEYTVKAGASITAPLSVATTDAQLDAVLDTLASLLPTGAVTVTSTGSIFNIKANDLGDMPDIVANGGNSTHFEVQTVKLSNYTAIPNTTFTLAFDGQTIAPALPVTATTAQVQAALNVLTSVKNIRADGTGSVVVTAPDAANPNDYQITFNVFGDQSSLASKLISDYLFARQLDTELVHGSTIDLTTTTTLQGTVDDILFATLRDGANGNPGVREIQTVTFTSGSLGSNPLAEFYLNVNANRTAFLPVTADVATVQAAISAILPALTPATNPITPNVTVIGAPGAYTITFGAFVNQPQLSGKIGIRETQTLNTSALNGVAGAEYVLTAGGDTTVPFDATATTAAQVTAISTLVNSPATTLPQVSALSGVTLLPVLPALVSVSAIVVTSPAPNIINIKAGDFGDMPDILARGGGKASHQVHDLDLTNFFSAPGVSFVVSLNGDTSIALPAGTTNPVVIENAINALANVQALRTGNSGKVAVTVPDAAKPHDFRIEYNIFGDQSAIIGVLNGVDTVNPLLSNGLSSRLGYNATPAQVEAALKAVNLVDVTVTAGAAQGLFEVVYKNKGDQPLIVGSVFTHEVQRVDPYGVGNFHITFNAESTVDFPINVTAATIEAAIEALPSFKTLTTGGVKVTANADSSFSIVFDGDKDMSSFSGQQFEGFSLNAQDGTSGRVEIQTLTPIFKGEFLTSKYNLAGLVGAIVDTNEIDSNIFTFIHNNILLKANPKNNIVFALGDMPVDGILMAKTFDQTTCNFTPEASLTAGGFFDNDNIIS